MPQQPDESKDELFDRAMQGLRDSVVPDGPPAEVVARVLANLGVAEDAESTLTRKKIFIMKPLVKLAVAAMLAIVIGGMLFWGKGRWGTTLAFADVVKEVRSIQAVQYTQKMTVSFPGQEPQNMSGVALISGSSKMRYTTEDGNAMVMDFVQGKFIMLNAKLKQAMAGDLANMPGPPQMNLLEEFQKLPDEVSKDAKPLESREIGGHKAVGFEIKDKEHKDQTSQVWVDSSTHLPLLVEWSNPGQGMMPPVKVTMSDFVWSPPVDEALMSVSAPAGYSVQPMLKIDMAAPTAADLSAGLKAIAELNGGTFPANIDMAGLQQVMRDLDVRLNNDKRLRLKMMAKGPGAMLTIGRMWMFVGNAENGEDWHYAGEGVALGQAGRAIFWYHPAKAKDYKVIDADLSEHDVAKDDLPKVPSKLVKNPASMPAATQPG